MIQRIVCIVVIAMCFSSCQSTATTDEPTTTVSGSTALPIEDVQSMRDDAATTQRDEGDDEPAIAIPQNTQSQATATVRGLKMVASATAITAGNANRAPGSDAQSNLQWESVSGIHDDKTCVIALVVGIPTDNWVIRVDNSDAFGEFTGLGTAAVCGLTAGQAVTVTIYDGNDVIVPGSQAIPTRGGEALYAKVATSGASSDMGDDSARGLRFRLDNSDANQRCVVVTVTGIDTGGWSVKGDGLKVSAEFDDDGVAELCGLNRRQEFTFSVYDAKEMTVAGGTGIPARGGDAFVAEWGDIAGAQQAPTATSAPVADNRALRVALKNSDDDPKCISVQIRGIRTSGWVLKADGLKLSANFDGAGNARLCGLARQQEFTFSVFTAKGGAVAGGSGIPARGGNIFVADWR